MKVIREIAWEMPFTCASCKSELVAEAGDVHVQTLCSFDDSETNYLVRCPSCGTAKIIKNADNVLPPKVLNGAKKD